MKHFLIIFVLFLPLTTLAHAGKLNAEGCHNNKKTGQYECHAIVLKEAKKDSKKTVKKTSKSDYNCADFLSQEEAQKTFIRAGGPRIDPYDLDRDKDGMACEK